MALLLSVYFIFYVVNKTFKFKVNPDAKNEVTVNLNLIDNQSCSVTGQEKYGAVISDEKTKYISLHSYSANIQSGKRGIVARVLNVEPLILEPLGQLSDINTSNIDLWASSAVKLDGVAAGGIMDNFYVDESLKAKILKLQFNDIVNIDVSTLSFKEPDNYGDYGLFTDVQKTNNKTYQFKDSAKNNKSGLLLQYSTDDAILNIFNDKEIRIFKKSKWSSVKLSEKELTRLEDVINKTNISSIKSDLTWHFLYKNYLALICNRYQKIFIKDRETTLYPLTNILDAIIQDIENAGLIIQNSNKKENQEYEVKIFDFGEKKVFADVSDSYKFVVKNMGKRQDTYSLNYYSKLGWMNSSNLPDIITLQSGAEQEILVPFYVPSGHDVWGKKEEITLEVKSISNSSVFSNDTVKINVSLTKID